jgi:hypothetical protein
MTEGEAEEFRRVAKLQYQEIGKLRAQLEQLRAENQRLLDWVMGDAPADALAYLQRAYNDPNASETRRDKCAIGALPFERSKPAATVHTTHRSLFDTLEFYRLNPQALRDARRQKTIEHQPPLDLESSPTALGHDGDGGPDAA